MAYNEFAYFYDEFNGEADYDALWGTYHRLSQLDAEFLQNKEDLWAAFGQLSKDAESEVSA